VDDRLWLFLHALLPGTGGYKVFRALLALPIPLRLRHPSSGRLIDFPIFVDRINSFRRAVREA